jgi:hypothetical protein
MEAEPAAAGEGSTSSISNRCRTWVCGVPPRCTCRAADNRPGRP